MDVPGYDRKIKFGIIHKFAYELIDPPNEYKLYDGKGIIIVATTRLETMLGDVAIAVNSKDPRYKCLKGCYAKHPFLDRKLKIIFDDTLVDMNFGTGAVKITPAHDENDFNCGNRHNLERINILTNEGKINENGGKFKNMLRYDARDEIRKELDKLGLFFGEEKNPMKLDKCSRSKDIIEPMLKPQWWMNCDNMAKKAMEAVFDKKTLKIIPSNLGNPMWKNFLGNIRQWCISRQLWWGHQIPAWLIEGKNEDTCDNNDWIIARTEEEAYKILYSKNGNNKSQKLIRDPDVLDTWFSSGLFPFSTMGWPDSTEDMKLFFPGHLLETGWDIIFFWVARMVMMSIELMNGQLPFKEVYLHPMIRDKFGMYTYIYMC